MKYFPYIIILFVTNLSAQLTIRNNNYIFVDDQVLFVEDNVNLQEADAKIYLRNEAQLIQGTGLTGNSGIGQLSVYQNGTTHNYAYNYWCSPIGTNSAALGNENFTANLIDDVTGLTTSTDAMFTQYDGTSSPLTIARYWIYTFENSDQYSDWFYRADTGTIAPGLGFTMKGTSGSSNNQLYDFRGKANTGTIQNSVTSSEWTLVGNPYPSAMDAVDFIHDTDNAVAITGTLYYWEQDLSVMSHNVADYVGGYATYTINAAGTIETFVPATFDTYNSDGSLNTTGASSTSGKQARRYIPIGQGFMVEGSLSTTGIVSAKNSHREYYKESNANSEFFRMGDAGNVGLIENNETPPITEDPHPYGLIPSDYKRFRLNIDFNDLYTRQLVQTFHDTEATAGFDYGLESKSPLGVSNDVYWSIDNEPYVAQALPFDGNMTIPLHVDLTQNTTIRIRAFDVQNFLPDQPIYIHDIETDEYINIRNMLFEVDLAQGEYPNRFEITFTNNVVLSSEEVAMKEFVIFQNNDKKELTILNPELFAIKNIKLYDLLGRPIWENEKVTIQSKYLINTSTLSDGIYIVTIETKDQRAYSKKIVLKE